VLHEILPLSEGFHLLVELRIFDQLLDLRARLPPQSLRIFGERPQYRRSRRERHLFLTLVHAVESVRLGVVIGQVRNRILNPDDVRHPRQQKVKVVRSVDGVDQVLGRVQSLYLRKRAVDRLAQFFPPVEVEPH